MTTRTFRAPARLAPPDERAARRSLLDQVARLEDELSGLFVSAWPRKLHEPSVPARGGPRLLTLGQLEALRDDLAGRLDEARRALAERTLVEEGHRVRIEEMLLDPAAHRWVRVSNADIGEPGCKHWHVRPRGGIIGMFASWWRVVISSGCPLPQYCEGVAEYGQHFARVAENYDALRREATDDMADWLVAAGDLSRGHALVDVGCGTGAMTALLTTRAGVTAVGVDVSEEMLQAARSRATEQCRFVQGRAEGLPFPDNSFDRGLMQTVVHLLDRPTALAEARRVLRDDAALLVSTVDPAGVDAFWLAEWFPSWADIDRRRFPTVSALTEQLRDAGFQRVETDRNPRRLEFTREHALSMLRARFASSFALIDEQEYERGLSRAEREMPDSFESVLQLVCVTGRTQ